jgi:hypothetical protein
MDYNLLDKQWIPVLYRDGRWERVGIRKALEDAGRIRQIAANNPMDRVAILRFLLALLYWCKGSPPDNARMNLGVSFPPEWFKKLGDNRDSFNLLGSGKRFCQNDAYKKRAAEHTTNYLIHEVPSGTNKWHFRHSTDAVDGLCPACCAMGLIRLPVFATSAGKGMTPGTGKSPGVNAKPPLYVIPVGASLAATLRLSWDRIGTNMGTPAWERANVPLPRQGEVPLLTGMTWLPRSVWLDDPQEPPSPCVSCGRTERLIRFCVFDGKGSSKTEGRIWRDPHVIYATTAKGEEISLHAGNTLGAADAAAGQWAKIVAGVLEGQESSEARALWVVGFSTVQNDKYLEATECLVPCSRPPGQPHELVAALEQWQKEGTSLVRRLRPSGEKKSSRKHVEISASLASIRPHVEGRVAEKLDELLANAESAWERAAQEYRPMIEVVAESISPGFTVAALQRRRQIAHAVPDMQTGTKESKKPNPKKGGDK